MRKPPHFGRFFVIFAENFVILHKNPAIFARAGRYFGLSRGLADFFSKTFLQNGIDKFPKV